MSAAATTEIHASTPMRRRITRGATNNRSRSTVYVTQEGMPFTLPA
jgi:hypothetical protein